MGIDENKATIRRPGLDDFSESAVIGGLRDTGEFFADTAGDATRAGLKLGRILLVCVLLPVLATPAVMAMQSSATSSWMGRAWPYAASIALAALAWAWVFKPEWDGRVSRRKHRLESLEDTSAARRASLRRDDTQS